MGRNGPLGPIMGGGGRRRRGGGGMGRMPGGGRIPGGGGRKPGGRRIPGPIGGPRGPGPIMGGGGGRRPRGGGLMCGGIGPMGRMCGGGNLPWPGGNGGLGLIMGCGNSDGGCLF